MSDEAYTEQDRANEGCCWDYPRDQCPKHRQQPCACVCHRNEPTRPANEQDMLQEVARLRRQRDAAMDMAQEDRAALASAEARAAAAEQRVAELERSERLGDVIIKANAESIADLEDERDRYRQRADAAEQRADAAVAALEQLRRLIGDDKEVGSVCWYLRQARVLYDGTRINPAQDASHRDRIVVLLRGLDSAILAAAQQGADGHEYDGTCRNVQHADNKCACNHPVNGRRCGQSRYAPIHRDAAPTAAPGATDANV